MISAHVIPALLGLFVGILISVVAWTLGQSRGQRRDDALVERSDDVLLEVTVLAAFILGACAAYFVLSLGL